MQTTREGQIKGKLSYMPPEQLRGAQVGRQSDIYAAGVMLWELITGQRLFAGDNEGAIVAKILDGRVEAPSTVLMQSMSRHQTLADNALRGLETLDSTVLRALAMNPEDRFKTAREMAQEIERKLVPATGSEVADWVEHIASEVLTTRATMVAEIESSTSLSAAEARDSSHVQNVMQAKSTLIGQTIGMPPIQTHPHPPSVATRLERPSSGQQAQPLQQTLAMGATSPIPRQMYPSLVDGPPVTQPSSISVASGAHLRQPESDRRGGRRTAVAAIAGVLLGVSVLASVVVYRNAQTKAKLGLAPTPSGLATGESGIALTATAVPVAVQTTPTPAEAPDASVAAASDTSTTAVAPSAVPKPSATAKTGVRPGAAAATVKPPPPPEVKTPPAGAAAADCATPVWFDAQGVKHYKPQCLDK
jgi:serine/threonine-protein kinase